MNDDPESDLPLPTEIFPRSDEAKPAAHPTDRGGTADTHRTPTGRAKSLPELPEIVGYDRLQFVARGGMGFVIKARHQVLDRTVAIKLPLPHIVDDDDSCERFLREAPASAKLQHANICPIHEVGAVNGRPFLVMGFVHGQTLDAWCAQHKPTARQAAEVVAPLARAVHYAHQHDVLHRDIKPSNVMVDAESDQPVLMDFGLAKEISQERSDLTHTGQVVGTPAYMSPEQAAGDLDQIGPQSDVYALGTVLYHLMAGRAPFTGNVGAILHKVQAEDPVPLHKIAPRVHRDFETVCMTAMSKVPAQRYASAAALAADLERFCAGEAIEARREHFVHRVWRSTRRHATAISAFAALLIVAAALTWTLVGAARRAQQTSLLTQQFNTGLNASQWSDQHAADLQRIAAELDALAPGDHRDLPGKITAAYTRAVRELMTDQPQLDKPDVAQAQAGIAWIVQRDPTAAAELQDLLQRRIRNWQPLFEVTSPFENLAEIIRSEFVSSDGDRIVRGEHPDDTATTDLVRTTTDSRGNAQFEVVFDPSWRQAQQLALRILSHGNAGYEFRLRKVGVDEEATPQLATQASGNGKQHPAEPQAALTLDAPDAGGHVAMEILRDDVILRSERLRRDDVRAAARDNMRLIVRREGNQLGFQLGNRSEITFTDIFPKRDARGGVFAIRWPRRVAVVSLRAWRQSLPETASPFEIGDDLFAKGKWQLAQQQYAEQAAIAQDPKHHSEAVYKHALCLREMGQIDEAAGLLEKLLAEANDEIYVVAASQLWLIRLRQRRYEDAEAIYANLSLHYRFEDLVRLVPSSDRQAIIDGSYETARGYNLLTFNEANLRLMTRADLAERLLTGNDIRGRHIMRVHNLMRGHHILGDIDEAARVAADAVARYRNAGGLAPSEIMYVQEYLWLLRQQGRSTAALEILDELTTELPSEQRHSGRIVVARARIHAALNEWPAVERVLDEYLTDDGRWDAYLPYAAAWLMRGYLHRQDGDEPAALDAWRQARFSRWAAWNRAQQRKIGRPSGMEFEYAIIAGALSQEFPKPELTELLSYYKIQYSGVPVAPAVLSQAHMISPTIQRVGKDPIAVEQLRRVVFQEVGLAEFVRIPLRLLLVHASAQAVPSRDWNEDERQAIWQLGTDALEAIQHQRIGPPQALQLVAAWKGVNNIFGWKGVAPSLSPAMRQPLAYVFGHRYERLGRVPEAVAFFQSVADQQAGNPRLAARARQQLDRIAAESKAAEPAAPQP